MRHSSTMIVLLVLIALATTAVAAPPTTVSYQGRLTTSAGAPVPNGTYSVRFSLWSDATLGTESWSETQMVSVTDGLFSTELGTASPFFGINCPGDCDGWLQIEVTVGGSVVTITPRSHLSASPWSLVSRSLYSENTSGAARSRGIITKRPGGGANGMYTLFDSDANGDGHPEFAILDSVSTSGAGKVLIGDANSNSISNLIVSIGIAFDEQKITMTRDDNEDGAPDGEITQSMTPTTSSMAINRKGTGADANRTISSTIYPDSAVEVASSDKDGDGNPEAERRFTEYTPAGLVSGIVRQDMVVDPDDDGTPDNSMESIVTPTKSALAIKTKGTGAQRQSIVIDSDSDSAGIVIESDSDGDGVPESSDRRTVSANAVHHNSVARSGSTTGTIRMAVNPDSAVSVHELDSDGDGIADHHWHLEVRPTGSSSQMSYGSASGEPANDNNDVNKFFARSTLDHKFLNGDIPTQEQIVNSSGSTFKAINTKGTGATLRVISEATDSALSVFESDADGDGHAETKAAVSAVSSLGGGGGAETAAYARMSADSDDDGTPDNTAEMTVTPTKSSLAIKTKGTGAQRFSAGGDCDDADAALHTDCDTDGDGVADGSIVMKSSAGGSGSIIRGGMSGSTTATIRMQATPDSTVFDLGYSGSTTGTIRMKAGSAGTANPIEHSSGAVLTVGGVWTNASDKRLKENFEQVDGAEILEKIEDLPISEWNYKAEGNDAKHIGPTAQDFSNAFGLGSSDKTISTIDPSGVALVAIKELTRQNKELKKKNSELENKLNDLQKQIEKLASSMKK